MYHIALCDDTQTDLVMLEEMIRASEEYDDSMEIKTYASGIDFLEMDKSAVDLLILDMQMNGLDGYETAKELRSYNSEAVLAFCSAVCMPNTKHFEVLPFRYLLKDRKEEMKQAIDELLREMKRRGSKKRIEATADGKAVVLHADEILYLSKVKRGTKVTLAQDAVLYENMKELIVREKLEELQEELCEEGFARPHSSFLVNLKKIKTVNQTEIRMDDGERISISRSCKEAFHRAFSDYFCRKYRRST